MIQYGTKPRTPFATFKTIMDAFKQRADLLAEQTWLEFIIFQVPAMELSKEDMMDLSLMVVKRVNAIVEFNFKRDDEIIEVTIRRVMGSK